MSRLDEALIRRIAEELHVAERSRTPVLPLTERYPDITPEDAYRIQVALIAFKTGEGARIVGRKIGLTSLAMQRMLGVGEPDYGHLLDRMVLRDGQELALGELIQPKAEPEIAFILGGDLRGPGVTPEQVLGSTRHLCPALEIIDSRIERWRIKLCDTIADNASSARVVLGPRCRRVRATDLRLVGMVLEKNGEVVQTGAGAAVLGHPARAVAWLANRLSEYGAWPQAGEIVLPGALTAAVDLAPGDTITAAFDRIGSVTVRCS